MEPKGLIFDIKRDCSEDGPGIRTTVFFKGCPMACVWCQNPEGKGRRPEISYRAEICHPSECGAPCLTACPAGCLKLREKLQVDYEACHRCDRCVAVCREKALEPVGNWIGLEELLYRVRVDEPFFKATGGGVTLSGGEPTLQMAFAETFLKRLKQLGIHTALETCGLFHYGRFREALLPHLDLIYFDLKLFDDATSRRFTGRSSRPILTNFSRLAAEAKIPVIPRIPLVPEITAETENLEALARFLDRHPGMIAELLPYHPLWQDKLKRLGKKTEYERRSFMTEEELSRCRSIFSFCV
ncbi:MAG: glycyl-radical enzyme activating protein [Candidatus Manganitrophaceae bacterium]